jgi:hypothetical protein
MGKRRFSPVWMALVSLVAGVTFLVAAPSIGAQPNASEQLVFSNSAAASPVGFWIWCEAESDNGYAGECNGSMYFYSLGIRAQHVIDFSETSLTELAEDQYRIRVISASDNGATIDCTLTNETLPVQPGPNNDILVSCTHPNLTLTASGSVVNVTG